jgi:hypothetical protein
LLVLNKIIDVECGGLPPLFPRQNQSKAGTAAVSRHTPTLRTIKVGESSARDKDKMIVDSGKIRYL